MRNNERTPTSEISQEQMDELLNIATLAFDMTVDQQNPHKAHMEVPRLDRLPYQPTGLLFFTKTPAEFPNAIFELRYTDNSFGENPDETEMLYLILKDTSNNLHLQVSDRISTLRTTELMHESVDFDETLDKNADAEMVQVARDDFNNELSESFALELLDLSASLRQASSEDYKMLRELLEHGLRGEIHYEVTNDWEQGQTKLEDAENANRRRIIDRFLRLRRK